MVAAILPRLGCAHGLDPWHEEEAIGAFGPSLGAAAQRVSGYGWKAVQVLDVNADGMGDVFWHHPERGLAATWLMEGNRLLAPGPILPCPLGGGWVATAGDFNGDGLADVLWNDVAHGRIAVELMEGGRPRALGPVIPGPGGGGWRTLPVDVNRDGLADVIWGHAEQGTTAIWLMEGTRVRAPGPVIAGPPGDGWVVAWTDDFDADGLTDVLWNHPEQNLIAVWLMDGMRVRVPGPVIPGPPGDGWTACTAGDVSRDGMADVVWQRGDTITVWLMERTRVLARGPLIPGPYDG